jgi:putative transposase
MEAEDCQHYKHSLYEAAESSGVDIDAYVLMTNYIHLLATADSDLCISLMMQKIG